MKTGLMILAGTLCLANTLFGQAEPPLVLDTNFMEYFDEAYSVYLDGSNRTAGIKGLTNNLTAEYWQTAWSNVAITEADVTNNILSINHTRTSASGNYYDIRLQTADWMGQSGIKFPHLAEAKGTVVDTLTGMFVDMSISGEITVTLTVKTDVDCQLRIDLKDANGRIANGKTISEYQNTQRIGLRAANGWLNYVLTWSDNMLDFYSGEYWGVSNGMYDNVGTVQYGNLVENETYGPEGTYLWAWEDGSHTSIVKTEIKQESGIPVTERAITAISFIIDDGIQGDIDVPVNVQIKDFTIGNVASAVDFVPVSPESIASGAIIYNPSTAVLVRAREEIAWPTSQFVSGSGNTIAKSPYVKSTISNLELQAGFSVQTIDLANYFANIYGPISFDFTKNVVSGDESALDIRLANGTLNIIEGKSAGSQMLTVYAIDSDNKTSVSQTFLVSYGGSAGNSAPYIVAAVNNFDLETGFTSYPQIVLDNIFADKDNELTYFVDVYSLSGGASSLSASIVDGKVELEEKGLGTSLLRISATDGFKTVRMLTEISVMEVGNNKPVVQDNTVTVALQANGSSTINLMDYVSDPDNNALSFSETTSTLKSSVIDGNNLMVNTATAGMQSFSILADDGKGGQTTFTVLAFVNSATNTAPAVTSTISTVTTSNNTSKTIVLSDKFSDSDAGNLSYFIQVADANIATVEQVNGKLTITPIGLGSTNVTVVAYDADGGYTEQTFAVAVSVTATEDKLTSTSTIAVFPTEVTDYLSITNASGTIANISSTTGTVVVSQPITNNQFALNLSNLKAGMYLLSIDNEVFKLIKK